MVVSGRTTPGTSSTVSAPQSLALRSEISMRSTLFLTSSGFGLDSGHSQCPMFITEWMRMPAFIEASLI